MHDLTHLSRLRSWELKQAIKWFPRSGRVLEIGAGTGQQARLLAEAGLDVEAIEFANNRFERLSRNRVWPIREYDGINIPFTDRSFQVVFSSNVMEHIHDFEAFQEEIRRVLQPGGVAIHIVPSASWRFWSCLTHYGYVAKNQFSRLSGRRHGFQSADRVSAAVAGIGATRQRRSLLRRLGWNLFPERHGEWGNVLTEHYHFSAAAWRRRFERTGWTVQVIKTTGLFYTAYMILGRRLSIRWRSILSRLLGSACLVLVLADTHCSAELCPVDAKR